MRKPTVSYRGFRLSRIREPQYRHLLYLIGWLVYFSLYFLTENLIPAERCHPVHGRLDDLIPFCEWFILPYVGWYGLILLTLVYFARYNTEGFKRFQTFIIVTQMVAMAVYILYPTRQDLRPEAFLRDNPLTRLTGLIYSLDTNTGVCPSLHVGYSLGIASAWLKEKSTAWYVKTIVTVFVIGVCLSVAFTKQHSVVDIFAAIPVCLVAEVFAFRNYYKGKKKVKA